MKQLLLLIFLLSLAVSCQTNDYESYHISGIGWVVLGAVGMAMFLIHWLKKGVVVEVEEQKPLVITGVSEYDFESMGSYIGGHPASENTFPDTLFRKNSDCCVFFYKDRSYSMPEFKFKIKVKSFKNISVEDLLSIENKLTSGDLNLTNAASNSIRKKKNRKSAFVTINWIDDQSYRSAVFSFEGKDSMQKAKTARENFLRALN